MLFVWVQYYAYPLFSFKVSGNTALKPLHEAPSSDDSSLQESIDLDNNMTDVGEDEVS